MVFGWNRKKGNKSNHIDDQVALDVLSEELYGKNSTYDKNNGKNSDYNNLTNIVKELSDTNNGAGSNEEPITKTLSVEDRIKQMKDEEEKKKRKRILTVLNEMKQQFDKNYQIYIKELIQNSIDADATRIDIDYYYNEDPKKPARGIVSIRDNGTGMSLKTIEEYFLKKFKSTKEDDITKIGRFGIGFISVFAQPDLERVLVETSNGEEEHLIKIMPPGQNWGEGRVIDRDKALEKLPKGTTVYLEIATSKSSFEKHINRLNETIKNDCAYITTPLYINKSQVNKDFDFEDASFQVKYGSGKELEIVMGYTKEPRTMFLNRRLVISNEKKLLFPDDGISVMVSSAYLDPNISRDAIIQNKRYKQILSLIEQKRGEMILELVKELETKDNFGLVERLYEKIDQRGERKRETFRKWEFQGAPEMYTRLATHLTRILTPEQDEGFENFFGYLASVGKKVWKGLRKRYNLMTGNKANMMLNKIPKEIRQAKIFYGLTLHKDTPVVEKFSLEEVIKQGIKEKGILCAYFDENLKASDDITKSLLSKGMIIVPPEFGKFSSGTSYQKEILGKFFDYVDIHEKYSKADIKKDLLLTAEEKDFVRKLRTIIDRSPLNKYVGGLYMSHYASDKFVHSTPKPYFFEYYEKFGSTKELPEADTGNKKSFSEKLKNMYYRSAGYQRNLSLNKDHNKIKDIIELSRNPDYGFLGYVAILESAAYELKHMDNGLPKRVKDFVIEYFKEEFKQSQTGNNEISQLDNNMSQRDNAKELKREELKTDNKVSQ